MKITEISRTEFLILNLMVRKGEMYGLKIVKESKNRIKKGTVYTTLSRMEDKGLVISRKESNPVKGLTAPRRIYNISRLGEKAEINHKNPEFF